MLPICRGGVASVRYQLLLYIFAGFASLVQFYCHFFLLNTVDRHNKASSSCLHTASVEA